MDHYSEKSICEVPEKALFATGLVATGLGVVVAAPATASSNDEPAVLQFVPGLPTSTLPAET